MKEEKKWIIDVRFIVKAKEDWLAINKWYDWMREADDNVIEYNLTHTVKELSEE